MLQGITFSMVETFKANLSKEMQADFEIKSGSLENLYAKSPHKVSRPTERMSDEHEAYAASKFKLGEKQMKILQKELDDKKLTKSDVLHAIIETKNLNVLPYTQHSEFKFPVSNLLGGDLTLPLEFKHL